MLKTPFHSNACRPNREFGLNIQAGISGVSLSLQPGESISLQPGESISLPAVHMGFFSDGFDAGTNSLRRYLYQRVCARLEGCPMTPPASYDHWFGIGNDYDENLLRQQADRAAELGLEYFVLDAAWHGGGFPRGGWGTGIPQIAPSFPVV